MAVTKTHPIKSTLKAAIDYICNPEKTDGKLLVSAYLDISTLPKSIWLRFSWCSKNNISVIVDSAICVIKYSEYFILGVVVKC